MLDDLWSAQQVRELDFIDQAAAPETKVFATSRFAKMAPGYVEVALGVLTEPEAVALLFGTAEVDGHDELQSAAARTISKQCGYLPLYVESVQCATHGWQ